MRVGGGKWAALAAGMAALVLAATVAPAAGKGKPGGGSSGSTVGWVDDLTTLDATRWMASDGWSNGYPFAVGWRADHVSFGSGLMTLQLDTSTCPSGCSGEPYASGEYRTLNTSGYGRYEVRMKPAAGSGLVSSFFTYTGPGERPPTAWDEIDIEFLGQDTKSVQTNFVANGAAGHEQLTSLGFDAAADFHNYAFVWSPDSITWEVDGATVRTVSTGDGPLPTTPGKLMMNLWTGSGADMAAWMGVLDPSTLPVTAQYDRVAFTPLGSTPPPPSSTMSASVAVRAVPAGRRWNAEATVTVVDGSSTPVSGASVSGTWTGIAPGTGTATTGSDGVATMWSARTTSTGTFTFCLNSVTAAGRTWDGVAPCASDSTA